MPFIEVRDGESTVLEIVEGEPDVRFQHWLKGTPFECLGEKCPFCAKRLRRSARFYLDVKEGGKEMTWAFGKRVFSQLAFIAIDRKSFAGLAVKLTRIGSGRDTQWVVSEADELALEPEVKEEGVEATTPKESPEAVVAALGQVQSLQEIARSLEGAAREGIEETIKALKDKIAADLGYTPGELEEIEF